MCCRTPEEQVFPCRSLACSLGSVVGGLVCFLESSVFSLKVSDTQGRLGTTRKPERQVARMVVVMIVAFLICWTPYAAFSVLVTAYPSIELDPRLAAVPAFFSKTATVYNPIIYVFMNKQVLYALSVVNVHFVVLFCKELFLLTYMLVKEHCNIQHLELKEVTVFASWKMA